MQRRVTMSAEKGDETRKSDVFVKEVSYTFSCLATTGSSV